MRIAFPAPAWGLLLACILALAAAPACAEIYKCLDQHGRAVYSEIPCGPDAQVVHDQTGSMPAPQLPKEPAVQPDSDDPTTDPVLRNPVTGPAVKLPAADSGSGAGGSLLQPPDLLNAGNKLWLLLMMMGVPTLAGILLLLIMKLIKPRRSKCISPGQ